MSELSGQALVVVLLSALHFHRLALSGNGEDVHLGLFASEQQIFMERQTGCASEVLPAVRKAYVELAPPTLDDDDGDLLRLEKQVGKVHADIAMLRQLQANMRHGGFKGTAVISDHHLIDFEDGDTTAHCYGAAFDVGTTTLAGALMDLRPFLEGAVEAKQRHGAQSQEDSEDYQ